VSSANASVFGLGFQGTNTRTWKQAGLFVDDPKIVSEIGAWFNILWSDPSLNEIGPEDAKRCPRRGPAGPPASRNKTVSLSEICAEDRCPIRLTFIDGDLDINPEAEKAAKRQKAKLKQAGLSADTLSKLRYFENYPAVYNSPSEWRPGDIAIEVTYYRDRREVVKKVEVGSTFLRNPEWEFILYNKKTKTYNSYAWDLGGAIGISGYGKVKFDVAARRKIKAALDQRVKDKPFSYLAKNDTVSHLAHEGMLLWELFK
jgi:hypothetical protein